MPDWKTHFIFSLFLVIIWISVFNLISFQVSAQVIIALFLVTAFSSLFPDVDMKKSKIRSVVALFVSSVVVALYVIFFTSTWYYAPVYLVLLYLILRYIPTKHRGIVHTFKFSLLFSVVVPALYFIFTDFSLEPFVLLFVASLLGYNMHLLIDKK